MVRLMRPSKTKNFLNTFFQVVLMSLVALAMLSPSGAEEIKPMRGFFLHGEPGPGQKASPETSTFLVIENERQFADFVGSLPDEVPSMKEPAPANPDPLRKGYEIDFSKNVLVVAIHRDTISAFPVYKGVQSTKGARVVKFDIPSPPPEARPYGWGVYNAVVLDKAGKPIKVETADVKGHW